MEPSGSPQPHPYDTAHRGGPDGWRRQPARRCRESVRAGRPPAEPESPGERVMQTAPPYRPVTGAPGYVSASLVPPKRGGLEGALVLVVAISALVSPHGRVPLASNRPGRKVLAGRAAGPAACRRCLSFVLGTLFSSQEADAAFGPVSPSPPGVYAGQNTADSPPPKVPGGRWPHQKIGPVDRSSQVIGSRVAVRARGKLQVVDGFVRRKKAEPVDRSSLLRLIVACLHGVGVHLLEERGGRNPLLADQRLPLVVVCRVQQHGYRRPFRYAQALRFRL